MLLVFQQQITRRFNMAIRLTGLARCGIAATLVMDDQVQTVAKKNPGAAGLLAGLALIGLAAGSAFGAGEAVLRIDDLTLGSVDSKPGTTTYRLTPAPMIEFLWSLNPTAASLSMTLSRQGASNEPSAGVELLIPFDPRVTPTTVLPSQWEEDGSLRLPAVINAPDFGQMLLSESRGQPLKSRLEGSRADKVVDLIVELPPLKSGESCTLNLVPIRLPAPRGLADHTMWEKARRGWFGAFQPSARWGDQTRPFSAPAGLLGNNVISDPASCSLWFQNGVRDAGGQGIDWTDWNGNATGYEGYLADSYRFLQAVLLREPAFRARYYRPLMQSGR
jgi:hypothetical protein